jgi:hypothetical protein
MRKQEVRGYEKSMGAGKPNPQIQESEGYEIKDTRFRKRPLQKKEKATRRDEPAAP